MTEMTDELLCFDGLKLLVTIKEFSAHLVLSSYHALRTAGVIKLPSERILRDYTHNIKAGVSFLPDSDKQHVKEADFRDKKDQFAVLCCNEIKSKKLGVS